MRLDYATQLTDDRSDKTMCQQRCMESPPNAVFPTQEGHWKSTGCASMVLKRGLEGQNHSDASNHGRATSSAHRRPFPFKKRKAEDFIDGVPILRSTPATSQSLLKEATGKTSKTQARGQRDPVRNLWEQPKVTANRPDRIVQQPRNQGKAEGKKLIPQFLQSEQ